MKKKDLFHRLEELSDIRNQFVVIGTACLVGHGVISSTDVVEIQCSKDVYESFDSSRFDGIEVFSYDGSLKSDVINGFCFMSLTDCLSWLVEKGYDKSLIKKVQLAIDCADTYKNERELHLQGYQYIGGVDEVGRGPLVGPVVAACCVLPENFHLEGLTDSKKLSEKKRDYFFEEIKKQAISYGIGIVSEKRIDEINIYEATKEAMIQAISNCSVQPDYVLTDAMKLDLDVPVRPIIKGDLRSITISAASVLAKVTRDRMMRELDLKYPMYDFKNNVGYPTKKHLEAIEQYGILPEHRRSYGPVSDYINSHRHSS